MSYNNRQQQQPDTQNSSVAGGGGSMRHRGSSGRDWETSSRDRSTGRQSYVPENSGSGGGGVVRDRMRSGSVDRVQRSPVPSQQQAAAGSSDGRSGYSRSQLGRWAGHDIWSRDDSDRDRERSSWDGRSRRDRDHSAANTLPASARYNRDGHQQAAAPPAFLSRHSVASFGRDRTYTPPPPPPPPPSFTRRATEPGEVLEEGELEIDDRSNPHAAGLGSRTYTLPAGIDTSAMMAKRPDIQSLGFRPEGRRPSSAIIHQHIPGAQQPRLTDRKFSQPLGRLPPPPPPPALSRLPTGSRNGTPSPRRLSPVGRESPRTPTPEPVRRESPRTPKPEVPTLEAQ
ncbi:hypothetical protein GGF42_007637, partial [Coemansia sp. RSA 2424]